MSGRCCHAKPGCKKHESDSEDSNPSSEDTDVSESGGSDSDGRAIAPRKRDFPPKSKSALKSATTTKGGKHSSSSSSASSSSESDAQQPTPKKARGKRNAEVAPPGKGAQKVITGTPLAAESTAPNGAEGVKNEPNCGTTTTSATSTTITTSTSSSSADTGSAGTNCTSTDSKVVKKESPEEAATTSTTSVKEEATTKPASASVATSTAAAAPPSAPDDGTGSSLITDCLRFDHASTIPDDKLFEKEFDRIANFLFNSCTLYIGQLPHYFAELEFYFNAYAHKDTFTHGDAMQMTYGNWYFHKTGGKYRSGTFKGMDLTFGPSGAYGGILVRGLYDPSSKTIKDGPCVCVDYILKMNKADSIDKFVRSHGTFVTLQPGEDCTKRALWLAAHPDAPRNAKLIKSPRVGLSLKNSTQNKESYIMRPYRYVAYPGLTKKGKHHMAMWLLQQGTPQASIRQTLCSTSATITKWVQSYESGKSKEPSAFIGGDLSQAEKVCELYGACSNRF
ncbi:hypothetical protein Pelo_11485 [Pelomyxa schiedti]|nr:hypothetical protein Pelo_11485 [Pelomyxa schiedti]